jgi:hypothetical protein
MTDTLKFPKGEFTHTELAQANGKTNQQVWIAYQKAIKDGVIVSAGSRPNLSGKGKPSKIWKVADGQPVPLEEAKPVVVVEVRPKTQVISSMFPVGAVVANLITEVDEALPVVTPTVAPTAVKKVVADTSVKVNKDGGVTVVRNSVPDAEKTDYKCPMCGATILSRNTATGVRVWCCGDGPIPCPCHESPFGHANNVKNAFEILSEKYNKR